jgi:outer membrane protein OmpA-like peptidoglycan-associated protein
MSSLLIPVLALCAALAHAQPASWRLKTERTVNGPDAALVVRTGDINNLGFGWPEDFNPFTGQSTPAHAFPWTPPAGAPPGTDRIMVGSAVTPKDVQTRAGDGYSQVDRKETMPQPISLAIGDLPEKIEAVLLQLFVDDFQSPTFHSRFQVSLNGTRIPALETALNTIDQTGPVGKLVTVKLLPEYWPLLRSQSVSLRIDDPTTHSPDGYAVDFVRILVNPKPFQHTATVSATVTDAETGRPLAGALISAAVASAVTAADGTATLASVPAGLVVVSASASGYDEGAAGADIPAGESGHVDIALHRHKEGAGDLSRAIARTGSAAVYGIHFAVNSASLRPESEPALRSVLTLLEEKPQAHWIISGHTDNQGGAGLNQNLSEARAAAVVKWLIEHGADSARLTPKGYGPSRPVADNATEPGRARNRRVEVELSAPPP